MRLILSYALLAVVAVIMLNIFVQPEIDRTGELWSQIDAAVSKATR